MFLIIFGIFSKISAAFLAIPAPLIGGMSVYLFASVGTSGIRILGYLDWTRRDRVIIAASLALALGVSVVPDWFTYVMPKAENNAALQGFYDAITTVISTGYILAGIVSILLNLILPYEEAVSGTDNGSISEKSIAGAGRVFRDEEAGVIHVSNGDYHEKA